jgi:hypothetical protein
LTRRVLIFIVFVLVGFLLAGAYFVLGAHYRKDEIRRTACGQSNLLLAQTESAFAVVLLKLQPKSDVLRSEVQSILEKARCTP